MRKALILVYLESFLVTGCSSSEPEKPAKEADLNIYSGITMIRP